MYLGKTGVTADRDRLSARTQPHEDRTNVLTLIHLFVLSLLSSHSFSL